jgi:hypothetical protein
MINQHCEPDVDLELQLMEELRLAEAKEIKISINYVESHGAQTKKKDLTDIERLHCQSDGLAKNA